jgi:carbon storage regulator
MLVLTRRLGEEIVIDGDIRVTVVAIKGDQVRLGVSAPKFVTVDREEVHQRRAEFLDPGRRVVRRLTEADRDL